MRITRLLAALLLAATLSACAGPAAPSIPVDEGLVTGDLAADLVATGVPADAAGDRDTIDWHTAAVCGSSTARGDGAETDFAVAVREKLSDAGIAADTLRVLAAYGCPERGAALETAIAESDAAGN
ncbi:hypothetical protein ACX8Z9_05880 [Arthrobacter halodurans]|uniref:DUF732 domain-containing protein n=1 Tax=Arthrobacter halodurans TaxID=516699 RepID=A0ABV4UNV3_9MICC